jgi:ATP-dependent protease HslVU (ClpYQ) peptidase subunit
MSHVLLSFAGAAADAEPIVEALRARSSAPIHVRDEIVRGLDFADAGTAERVTGALRRVAIELVVAEDDVPTLVATVEASRRRLPARWMTLPVREMGRLA